MIIAPKSKMSDTEKISRCLRKVEKIQTDVLQLQRGFAKGTIPQTEFSVIWKRISGKMMAAKKLSDFAINLHCIHDWKFRECIGESDIFACKRCDTKITWSCIDMYRASIHDSLEYV